MSYLPHITCCPDPVASAAAIPDEANCSWLHQSHHCEFNFRLVIFKLNLVIGGWGISYEIALRWMPLDLTDDKSTLVQVMAWCRQATSHYLSQGWPRSMPTNGITRPQWVNVLLTVMLKKEKKTCLNILVYIVLNQYTKLCLMYVWLIIIHTFTDLN